MAENISPEGKRAYFASDFHLGVPNAEESRKREQRIINWLDKIKEDAHTLYLVGDVFDFWFEYRTVVPRGYVRLLGKLGELSDRGIAIHFFTGNHDMWVSDYLSNELNVTIHRKPLKTTINGKKFFIGHGDGLGPGDLGYKLIKKVFANPFAQWAFKWIHPDIGIRIATYWSKHSRINNTDEKFLGEEKEWLIIYSKEILKKEAFDYFIFGHRHLPIDFILPGNARYINLGEWVLHNTYAVFNGNELKLEKAEYV